MAASQVKSPTEIIPHRNRTMTRSKWRACDNRSRPIPREGLRQCSMLPSASLRVGGDLARELPGVGDLRRARVRVDDRERVVRRQRGFTQWRDERVPGRGQHQQPAQVRVHLVALQQRFSCALVVAIGRTRRISHTLRKYYPAVTSILCQLELHKTTNSMTVFRASSSLNGKAWLLLKTRQ